MLQRTEGIVLKTFPFGEADLIVTYLTASHGIVKTFAKSPRKVKSKFGSSLEPLTHARISFWGKEDAALPRLTQSDIIHSFHPIRSSLRSFLKISEIIEMILGFVPEKDPNAGIYSLLLDTLKEMEADCDARLLLLCCKLRLLDQAGYLPRLKYCGRCGKTGDVFYLAHGSVLCEGCSKGYESSCRISPAAVTLSANLLGWTLSKLHRIKPSEHLVGELSLLVDEHVKYVLEKTLRTKAFNLS